MLLAKLSDKGLEVEATKQVNDDMSEYLEIPLEDNIIQDRIYLAVMKAIDSIETESLEDTMIKTEMLLNIDKYLTNYENLRPLLERYFNKGGYERDEQEER